MFTAVVAKAFSDLSMADNKMVRQVFVLLRTVHRNMGEMIEVIGDVMLAMLVNSMLIAIYTVILLRVTMG